MNIDWDKLHLAYDWAREWQILLAGVLVFLAALIFAWATIRAAKISAAAKPEIKLRSQSDLRQAPAALSGPAIIPPDAASPELIGALEQLRSLIRSALGSLPQTSEKTSEKASKKESSPAYFLCQRILHLRLDQLPPPAQAGKDAQDGFAHLLKQLNVLRSHLKKDAPPADLSEILVQINTSARGLGAALAPAAEKRRQAETR